MKLECSDVRPEHFRAEQRRNSVNSIVSEFGSGTVVFHEVSFLSSECQAALQELLVRGFQAEEAHSGGSSTDFHNSRESGARGSPRPVS